MRARAPKPPRIEIFCDLSPLHRIRSHQTKKKSVKRTSREKKKKTLRDFGSDIKQANEAKKKKHYVVTHKSSERHIHASPNSVQAQEQQQNTPKMKRSQYNCHVLIKRTKLVKRRLKSKKKKNLAHKTHAN